MNLFFDSFWRALAYCLRPRVIALTFFPLLLMVGAASVLVYVLWEPAVDMLQRLLAQWAVLDSLLRWMDAAGLGGLRMVVAPLLVLMLTLPLTLLLCLLVVAWFMTPALVRLVAERRFPDLAALRGARWWQSLMYGLVSAVLAVMALVITLPLWLIPQLAVLLPPLIWGWLTYRVMVFDVLAEHASAPEREQLVRRYRVGLLVMGVVTGYLGAMPGMVWVVGAMAIVMAPLLVPLAIWIYTLVFVFSSLWFAHFCLAALQELRNASAASPSSVSPPVLIPPAEPPHEPAPPV